MKAEHVRKFIKPKGKFHPFVVRTSSGEGYSVRSPEMVWMSPDDLLLIVDDPGQGVTMIDTDEVTECHRGIKRRTEDKGTDE